MTKPSANGANQFATALVSAAMRAMLGRGR